MSDTATMTPGLEIDVAHWVQRWRDSNSGKITKDEAMSDKPLQLLNSADIAYFIGVMKDEESLIEAQIVEQGNRHRAIIAKKDAEIAAINREIETNKARIATENADIERRANERVGLIADAKRLAPGLDTSKLNNDGIRKEAVRQVMGDEAVEGKALAYIDARFDILASQKAADPFAAVVRDGLKTANRQSDPESAYAEMNDHMTNAWKSNTQH